MRRHELHPITAALNSRQKNKSKVARHEALAWLAQEFPQAFDNTLRIRPLKLGIVSDILMHADRALAVGISKSKLREAVVLFTRRVDYLTVLKAREMRVDLEGNPTHPVTEEEAEHAALKIKKRVEKSAKNARKNLIAKPSYHSTARANHATYQSTTHESTPAASHHEKFYTGTTQSEYHAASSAKAAEVIVKNKASRTYDPNAVARLKEKLGLSQTNKELTD